VIDPRFWKGRRILLTGHSGFKGSWLALWLSRMGAEVYGFSLPPETKPALFELAHVGDGIKSVFGNLNDRAAVEACVRRARPEIVLHLAARAIVRQSIIDPVDTISSNVLGTAHLLEALRDTQEVSTILVVTSDKVYANDESGDSFTEASPLGGKDPYSASKAAAEMVVRSYRETYFRRRNVRLATARGGNVIGGGDYAERIAPDIVRAIAAHEKPVLRMPNATRPWQHVLDCLSGYLVYAQALERRETEAVELNFGPAPSAPQITVGELTSILLARMDKAPEFIHVPDPNSVEMHALAIDSSRARALIGWQDLLPGRAAIDWTADWHRRVVAGEDARVVTLSHIEQYMTAGGSIE
jgi:CDP-glucose 4,6-dehydratase